LTVSVKICGLVRAEDADAVLRAGAEFAGLVFHPRSPRRLSPENAMSLAARLRGRARIVALFADPNDDELAGVMNSVKPDFVQLHGAETPDRLAAIRSRFGCPVIKAMAIADTADFASLPAYEAVADMLLFDAKPAVGAAREGGHGRAFDWRLLRGRTMKRPWLLAGGLTAENVARAIRAAGAPGVDVSSGVESAPGIKDGQAIADFIAAARNAQFAHAEDA
jgi:phosphoribosylanthranilate isomerase